MRRLPRALLLFLPTLLTACPAPPPPSIDLSFPHGERALAVTDLALVERQPGDTQPIDVRSACLGRPCRVVPRGAIVVRAPADHADASRGQNPSFDPAYNPWIFVTVQSAAVEGLVDQSGWVLSAGLTHLAPGSSPPPDALDAQLATGLISTPTMLCPTPSADQGCELGVSPQMPMRTFGCEGTAVRVETWATDGTYVAGFLPASAFATSPCGAP